MENQAIKNREEIADIKTKLDFGQITYAEAKSLVAPIVERINEQAVAIAKKYGMRPQKVSVISLLR